MPDSNVRRGERTFGVRGGGARPCDPRFWTSRISGIDVAREIRRRSRVPIIMLTARSQEIDCIVGFEIGADDYITKPFSPRELVLRVQALLRRASGPTVEAPVQIGNLVVDLSGREVRRDGAPIDLTATEFDLLAFLVRQPNHVFTRMQLLKEV